MPDYRLIYLDRAGGILKCEWLDALTDEEAVRKAISQSAGLRFEIWCGQREIGHGGPSATSCTYSRA